MHEKIIYRIIYSIAMKKAKSGFGKFAVVSALSYFLEIKYKKNSMFPVEADISWPYMPVSQTQINLWTKYSASGESLLEINVSLVS